MKVTVIEKKEVEVKFIKVSANVRHWEDAEVNGESSEDGDKVPFKKGGLWEPLIDIEKGVVVDWPKGMVASFHFKVCDGGSYYLLDEGAENVVASIDNNYVPSGLCHGDRGFGDYIIFNVNRDGSIANYCNTIDPDDWIDEDED
jgi:hypothetical protein